MIPQFTDQISLLAVALIIAVELVLVVWKHPAVGLWLFMAAYLASVAGWRQETVIAGLQVHPLDLVCIALLIVSILRMKRLSRAPRGVAIFGALLAIALARGLEQFGTATATNSARGFIYVITGMIFANVCLHGRWKSIEAVWFAAASVLGVSAIVFVARNGLGNVANVGDRPLNSGQALIVAQASLLALTTSRGGRWRLASVAGFSLVLISQQRTVWAATLAMALVLAYHPSVSDFGPSRNRVRAGLGAAFLGSVALVIASPGNLRNSLASATSEISAEGSTLGWRLEGWRVLVDDYAKFGVGDQLIGQPLGVGTARLIDRGLVTSSPHNMYISVLLAMGILGLIALLFVYLKALQLSWRVQPVLAAVIIGLFIYSVGYQIESVQGIWLGLALALSSTSAASETTTSELQTA